MSEEKKTEDDLAPHLTGWCTVGADNKILLDADTYELAVIEARGLGLALYADAR